MSIGRLALTFAFVAPIACGGSAGEPVRRCIGEACTLVGDAPSGPGVLVENQTGSPVLLRIRDVPSLNIDHRVFEGTLPASIGPAMITPERTVALDTDGKSLFAADVWILGIPGVHGQRRGAVLGIGNGPSFLAVGDGRLFVRTRDGANVLEAEDPEKVRLVPIDRGLRECVPRDFGVVLEDAPRGLIDGATAGVRVTSVERGADGCHTFHLASDGATSAFDLRACLPTSAFPFADGEDLVVDATQGSYFPTVDLRFSNASGDALQLVHVRAVEATASATAVAGISLSFLETPTCVSVERPCADTRVPVTITASFDGGTSRVVQLGTAITTAAEPRRTYFLLQASARPISIQGCTARPLTDALSSSDAFVAVVDRATTR